MSALQEPDVEAPSTRVRPRSGGALMEFFSVRNWERFQHYKERNPPWIKLHTTVLDDPQIFNLTDAQRYHLFGIWLLAARTGNLIPFDSDYVRNRINSKCEIDLKHLLDHGFIFIASETQAESEQVASKLYRSEEERREEERERKKRASKMQAPSVDEVAAEIKAKGYLRITAVRFHEFYEGKGWMIGRSPMVNWRMALSRADREWDIPKNGNRAPEPPPRPGNFLDLSKEDE